MEQTFTRNKKKISMISSWQMFHTNACKTCKKKFRLQMEIRILNWTICV